MYWHDGWHWGAGLVMFLFMAGLWLALAMIIGYVFRRDRLVHHTSADAQRILNERFARGDLDQDEYERRSAALRNTSLVADHDAAER